LTPEGAWLQAYDGTAVLVDTQQSACTITVSTIEVLPHAVLASNECHAAAAPSDRSLVSSEAEAGNNGLVAGGGGGGEGGGGRRREEEGVVLAP